MRRWFLTLETELMRVRFIELFAHERVDFFALNKDDFNFDLVDREGCEVSVAVRVCSLRMCVWLL